MYLFAETSVTKPQLCPNATWNPNGTTFADNNTVGMNPYGLFINTNNTVYVANHQNGHVLIWLEGSTSPTGMIATNSITPLSIFVSSKYDVYLDSGEPYARVDMWRENASNYSSTLNTGGICFSLFMVTSDSIYCALAYQHQVIKRSLNSSDTQITFVAGNWCPNNLPHTLYYPCGIFVNINFDLYVADTGNHRIQLFRSGQVNGTTLVGREVSETMQLHRPSAVTLDADENLYIVDHDSHRIVTSGLDGFRCVIGCTGTWGSASNQLFYPQSMAFDIYGNIFVTDTYNHRVQKFFLSFNSCSKCLST